MKNINKNTIIRTIVLIIALINQILLCLGMSPLPFEDENLCQNVSTVVTVSAALWGWWKNNSFTKEAIKADEFLKECKNCKED